MSVQKDLSSVGFTELCWRVQDALPWRILLLVKSRYLIIICTMLVGRTCCEQPLKNTSHLNLFFPRSSVSAHHQPSSVETSRSWCPEGCSVIAGSAAFLKVAFSQAQIHHWNSFHCEVTNASCNNGLPSFSSCFGLWETFVCDWVCLSAGCSQSGSLTALDWMQAPLGLKRC